MITTLRPRTTLLPRLFGAVFAAFVACASLGARAQTAEVEPPSRVARIGETLGQVWLYSPDTGEEYWKVVGNMGEVIPTPVAGHGFVFCSCGRPGPTFAIRPRGSGDASHRPAARAG